MSFKRPGNRLIVFLRLSVGMALLFPGAFRTSAQTTPIGFLDRPDSLDRTRFWTAAGAGAVIYAGTFVALNDIWYADYPKSPFHTFDDSQEWLQMDKAGHAFSAYFQSDWAYAICRWTGMKRPASIWAGMGTAMLVQTTIEVLDGHSSEWGFSWYDMAANTAGAGLWGVQQAVWDEQRFRLKVSGHYKDYPADPVNGSAGGVTTIDQRADDLFGTTVAERFLKDYNAQTIWLSSNISAFLPEQSKFPKWLNIAAGYGAENMFGGFSNTWTSGADTYSVSTEAYPRYRQLLLSPDIDFSRIRTRSKPLKLVFGILNIFKCPAPAVIFSKEEGVSFRWIEF